MIWPWSSIANIFLKSFVPRRRIYNLQGPMYNAKLNGVPMPNGSVPVKFPDLEESIIGTARLSIFLEEELKHSMYVHYDQVAINFTSKDGILKILFMRGSKCVAELPCNGVGVEFFKTDGQITVNDLLGFIKVNILRPDV